MTKEISLNIIVAATPSNGIGFNGTLPWRLKPDMQYFQKLTIGYQRVLGAPKNIVIMGRKTWESIPPAHRPLKERINIVLSRNAEFRASLSDPVLTFESLDACLAQLPTLEFSQVFIIGGGQIYKESLPLARTLFLTRVFYNGECDTFLQGFQESDWKLETLEGVKDFIPTDPSHTIPYEFLVYSRRRDNLDPVHVLDLVTDNPLNAGEEIWIEYMDPQPPLDERF